MSHLMVPFGLPPAQIVCLWSVFGVLWPRDVYTGGAFQRDFRERIQQQKSAQSRLREQRQQVARASKYHSSYHTQLRARLTRARSREEKVSCSTACMLQGVPHTEQL